MSIRDKIRRGEAIPLPVSALLQTASIIQRFGMWRRLRQPVTSVDARVISFGNLTAGGTGKTPAVLARAEKELAAGRKVAILTRGYGAAPVKEPLVHLPGESIDARRFGDEPALLARRLPDLHIVRDRNRVRGAKAAIAAGCDTLILDDGYQAVTLARDENILLIDALQPFGNGYLIPRGILREPIAAMNRATSILITRCDQAEDIGAILTAIARHAPGIPLLKTRHAPSAFRRLSDGQSFPLNWFSGKKIAALCAIGHPESFFRLLASLGAQVTQSTALPDHAGVPETLLKSPYPVVMTEKDAARLSFIPENAYALVIQLEEIP